MKARVAQKSYCTENQKEATIFLRGIRQNQKHSKWVLGAVELAMFCCREPLHGAEHITAKCQTMQRATVE